MPLNSLSVTNFRNIKQLSLCLAPHFNIIYGDNGAGKTSLLESLYYLASGKSFRTSIQQRMMQNDQPNFQIHVEKQHPTQNIHLGIQKDRHGSRVIRINGENSASMTQLAQHLPIKVITTHSYRFFYDGPKQRRQCLDWGVFHVKPNYAHCWQHFQKILKQRNAALKNKRPRHEIENWNTLFCEYATELSAYRSDYVEQLIPLIHKLITALLPSLPSIEVRFSRGWDQKYCLEEALEKSFPQDVQYGYTLIGPQRADLNFYYNSIPFKDYASQGQQKLALHALYYAQGELIRLLRDQSPLYLIDDLPAELDQRSQQSTLKLLSTLNSQILITALDPSVFEQYIPTESKMFHMKQGSMINL